MWPENGRDVTLALAQPEASCSSSSSNYFFEACSLPLFRISCAYYKRTQLGICTVPINVLTLTPPNFHNPGIYRVWYAMMLSEDSAEAVHCHVFGVERENRRYCIFPNP
jgi:hypothetical protein